MPYKNSCKLFIQLSVPVPGVQLVSSFLLCLAAVWTSAPCALWSVDTRVEVTGWDSNVPRGTWRPSASAVSETQRILNEMLSPNSSWQSGQSLSSTLKVTGLSLWSEATRLHATLHPYDLKKIPLGSEICWKSIHKKRESCKTALTAQSPQQVLRDWLKATAQSSVMARQTMAAAKPSKCHYKSLIDEFYWLVWFCAYVVVLVNPRSLLCDWREKWWASWLMAKATGVGSLCFSSSSGLD